MGKTGIKTKAPRPKQSGVLLRRRLFKEIDAGRERSIVWISGPAGSGKTTLASSYLDARKLSSLWHRLDESDSDLASFFYHLGLAAQKAAPRYRKPLPLLTPEYMMGLPTFTKQYFLELYRRLSSPFVIVFDDYHVLKEDSSIHAIIQDALALVPEGITVLVLSRGGVPPTLARQRAEKRISLLDWKDLRFTLEECRGLLPRRGLKKIPDAALQHLHRDVQGWAAGIVLLMEAQKTQQIDFAPNGFEPGSPEIFAYFASEVLDKLDSATRDFLLLSSFLPRMTAKTAKRMTDAEQAERMLSLLHRNNFFTEKHPGKEPMYEYHPLFREFLVKQVKDSLNPEGVRRLQDRAATVLEEAGQIEDAIALLIEAENWNDLVPVLLKHAPEFVAQGRSKTLLESLEMIPVEIRMNIPWLHYWIGICKMTYSPTESRGHFEAAFRLFEDQKDINGALVAWSGAVNTFFFEFLDFKPLDKWIEWLDARIGGGLVFSAPEIEARVAASMMGALLWRMPGHDDMKKWVNRTKQLSTRLDCNSALRAYLDITLYYIWMGELDEAKIAVEEMKRMQRSHPGLPLLTIMVNTAEALFYNSFTGSYREALQAVSRGLETGQSSGVHIMDFHLLAHGVHGFLNAGDSAMARSYLSKMEQALVGRNIVASSLFYHLSAWTCLLEGKSTDSCFLAKKSVNFIEMTGAPVPEACDRLIAALASYDCGDCDEAEKQLEALRSSASRIKSLYMDYLYHIARAYIDFDQKKESSGREHLHRGLTLGREKNFAMLNFFRPALTLLCIKALDNEIESEYVKKLIRSLDIVPDRMPANPDSWPWEIAIATLGKFEIRQKGKRLQFSTKAPKKLLMVLKSLISYGPKGVDEEQLADMIWPDVSGDTALQSLDTSLHRLRQLLGNDKIIVVREGRISFDNKRCYIDAHAFESLLSLADEKLKASVPGKRLKGDDCSDGILMLERALTLYSGQFLDATAEAWAMSYRERLRNKYLKAVQRLGAYYEKQARFDEAIRWYEKGLEVDDVAEPFYQSLIKCYGNTGRSAEASAVYHRCERMLKAVLNIAPSTETQQVFNSYQK